MGTRSAKRWPLYTFILFVVSLVLPSIFLIGFGSPAGATLNANTDDFQITYKANASGYLVDRQSDRGQSWTPGGIAVSGNFNVSYSWDAEGTTPTTFTDLADAKTKTGTTDNQNSIRYIPIPTQTVWRANENVTLTIKKKDNTSRLYGFHGWQPNMAEANRDTGSGTLLNNKNWLINADSALESIGDTAVEIKSFGTFLDFTSLEDAFFEAPGTFVVSAQLPTTVRSLESTFRRSAYNSPAIVNWDVSRITNMANLFDNASSFNQNISSWNVGSVSNFSRMFEFASSFNQPIGSWNTSSATDMNSMFNSAINFNQPIGAWNLSNVTNTSNMFKSAGAFNQPLASWDVSRVTSMYQMFLEARSFNQPIGNWNVASVTNMGGMFARLTGLAMSFNQNLASWDVSRVTTMSQMFLDNTAFNNGENYSSTATGTRPLGWNSASLLTATEMFRLATRFNQNLDDLNVFGVVNFDGMFRGATGFNNGMPSGASGSLNWELSLNGAKSFSGTFQTATSFNQSIYNWDMFRIGASDGMLNGSKYNHPLGNLQLSSATTNAVVLGLSSMSQANYEATVIDWAYRPAPASKTFDIDGGSTVLARYTTCLSKAADANIAASKIERFDRFKASTEPSGCTDRTVSWSNSSPYSSPQNVSGQANTYIAVPIEAASSTGAIKYMITAREGTSDCKVDPDTGAVTYKVLNVSCTVLAYSVAPDASALSSVQKVFTTSEPTDIEVKYEYESATANRSVTRTIWRGGQPPITLPAPIRDGYVFDAWYSSTAFTTRVPASGNAYSPTQNITLYAKFDSIISFDSQGGPAVSSVTVRATSSTTLRSSSTLTRDGYTFDGWYSNTSFTTRVPPSGFTYTPTGSATLFAKWSPTTLNVTFQTNGGSSVSSTTTDVTRGLVQPPGPTRSGYSFAGWFTDSNLTAAVPSWPYAHGQTSNFTLYAKWTLDTLTVTYDTNGGSSISSTTTDVTRSVLQPSNPTRPGYTFAGWFTNLGLSSAVPSWPYAHAQGSNFTLYAKWTANSLTVTYQTNGGSSISSTTTDVTRTLTQPSNPTRDGFTFAGWFTDSNLTTAVPSWPFAHSQTSDFTLYAKWTAITLNVTYQTNLGSSISSTTTDATRTLAQPASPTRAGYNFAGWFTDSNLTTAIASWPFTHGQTADFTIYAKWTAKTLVVTYQTNGGSTVSNGSTVTAGTISSAPTAPTRSGFDFVAWYEDSLLTTAVTWPYTHGKTEDFTLYAKWQSRAQNALEWNLSSTSVAYLGSLNLATTGGSGTGSVTYSVSNNSTCTVSGSTLTPGSAGSICVVTATKAADASFDAISTSAQTITVTKINQSPLTWNLSATSVAYRGSLTLATSGGSGNGAVVFSVGAGSDCSIAGTTLLPGDVGSLCQITATKVSDTNYNSADTTTQSITVTKINQATLSFSNANTLTFGQVMDLLAVGGTGNGSISYSVTSAGTTGCSLSGVRLSVTGAGTCAVSATKAASTNYNISNTATLSITVSKASQTVSFTSTVPSEPVTGDTYTAAATATSGLTPVISVSSGNCTVTSNVVTFTGSGNCVIRAIANSSNQYLQSDAVTQTIAVGQKNQTLVFDSAVQSITQKTFGDPAFIAKATSSEPDLIPTYSLGSATTNSACAVTSNGIVVVLAVGICEVVVNQAGNSDVAAASAIRKSINIVPDQASAPYITSVSAGHESITAAFIKPTYLGGASISGYQLVAVSGSTSITNSACSVNGSSSTQTCTVSGLDNGTSYQLKVAAITSAGIGLYSELSAARIPATNPAAVSAFTAVPNNTVIDLAWQDPVSLGGGVFDSYRIFYKKSSDSSYPTSYITLNSQTPRSYQITSLINGESYDVKIVTVTQANTQALVSNTAEAKETPRTVPDSPATLDVIELDGNLVITWTTPTSDGGNPITEYKITVNGVDCTPSNALDQHCLIAAPTSPGTHPVVVKAKNDAGFGAPAATNFIRLGSSSAGGGSEYSSYRGNFIEVYHINIKNLPATGGQVVKIRGRNFAGVTTITVGDFKARILSVSDSVIRFVAPQGVKGSAHLKLQGPNKSSEVRDAFVYFNGRAKPAVRWVLGYIQAHTLLSSEAKAKLRSTLSKNPQTVAVTCIGYQSWSYDTPKDDATVIGRAKQACSYLKKLNPALQTRSVVARTNLTGTPSRKLSVQFRSIKFSKSSK